MSGATAAGLIAKEIYNMNWNVEECAPTVFASPAITSSGMLATAVRPDILIENKENDKKLPS